MRTPIGLLVGWLLAAMLVLGMDGRLPVFLAWVARTACCPRPPPSWTASALPA
jgi:hypothetical protein